MLTDCKSGGTIGFVGCRCTFCLYGVPQRCEGSAAPLLVGEDLASAILLALRSAEELAGHAWDKMARSSDEAKVVNNAANAAKG